MVKIKKIKRALQTCPECGSSDFIEDPARGELICSKCGLVLKEEIVDTGQEWRAFDSEQIARRARGGAPLSFSVDYEEPILIKKGEKVEVVKIGEFVDRLIEENKSKVVKDGILDILFLENSDMETVAFDSNYTLDFRQIAEVSRHPVNELYEVKVEGGKKIKVTGAHSLFTVRNNKVIPVKVVDLKIGDFVVAPRKLPSPDLPLELSKNLIEDLPILYSQLGIAANYVQAEIPGHIIQQTGQPLPTVIANMPRITDSDVAADLGFVSGIERRKRKGAIEDLIPAPVEYRKEWKSRKRARIGRELAIRIARKYNDKDLLKLATAPFMFLRVRDIRLVKPTREYAYDLSVPSCENFVCSALIAKNTKHDKGLTTEIGKGLGELYKVPPKKRAQYYRLTKWQKRFIRAKDRNISFALSELQRIVSFLNLPRPIHERIARYYEECVERGLVRGRSIEAIVAALTYAVARMYGSPRTLDELVDASGVDKREIGRSYRYIARELGIKILPAEPEDFVPRFCSILGLSDRVVARTIKILKEARKRGIVGGKGPTGVAAAAIYIGSVLVGEKRTQREIADMCNITEVTIRGRYRELVEKLGIEEEVERKAAEE